MNKVILIGNLCSDPQFNTTANGISVCKFSLAVQRRFAKDGEQDVDFINIVTWRGLADNCNKYLKKGNKCGVVGAIQTRNYDSQDGTKHYVTEILADDVEFLTPKTQNQENQPQTQENKPTQTAQQQKFEPIDDDNLPF